MAGQEIQVENFNGAFEGNIVLNQPNGGLKLISVYSNTSELLESKKILH